MAETSIEELAKKVKREKEERELRESQRRQAEREASLNKVKPINPSPKSTVNTVSQKPRTTTRPAVNTANQKSQTIIKPSVKKTPGTTASLKDAIFGVKKPKSNPPAQPAVITEPVVTTVASEAAETTTPAPVAPMIQRRVSGEFWPMVFVGVTISVLCGIVGYYLLSTPSIKADQRDAISNFKDTVKVIRLKKSDQLTDEEIRQRDAEPTFVQPESPTPPSKPDTSFGDILVRNYAWKYNNQDYTAQIVLNKKILENYARSKDGPELNYEALLNNSERDDDGVAQLVGQLKKQAEENGLNDQELVELAMSFVQSSITYDYAKAANNKTCYRPYELLDKKEGVCIDKSILGLAILKELNVESCLITMQDINHAAIGLGGQEGSGIDGSKWTYLETTANLKPGEMPLYQQGNLGPGIIKNNSSRAANLGELQFSLISPGKPRNSKNVIS